MLTKVFKVPLLLLSLEKLSVHEVVEALTALQNVIHSCHNTKDTEGEGPDTDHGNNVCSSTHKPPENGKTRSKDVDNQDRPGELP